LRNPYTSHASIPQQQSGGSGGSAVANELFTERARHPSPARQLSVPYPPTEAKINQARHLATPGPARPRQARNTSS